MIEAEGIFLEQKRKKLHQFPELSNKESKTAEQIIAWLSEFQPSEIIKNIGGNGLIAVWEGNENGKTVCLRAELDALPIQEVNDFSHQSTVPQVSHKCGHDGHMAILLGVARRLAQNPIQKGKVILLFQTAEETGEGALQMLKDEKLKHFSPDYIFALHNLPSYPKGQILCRKDTFAAASKGIIIQFDGATAHAGEPENGISPALAMAEMLTFLHQLPQNIPTQDFSLVTVVHALLGEIAFGVAPAHAEIRATLRSYLNEDLELLAETATQKANELAKKHKLKVKIDFTEYFSATSNEAKSVAYVEQVAQELGLSYKEKDVPFRWSEDFGQFTQKFKGAMFGLGAGQDTPQLHNADYDFPDEIALVGVNMFDTIIRKILSEIQY